MDHVKPITFPGNHNIVYSTTSRLVNRARG